jgi:5-methyltetrahydropteroyltriglutamate--homocysteine methyltransferase
MLDLRFPADDIVDTLAGNAMAAGSNRANRRSSMQQSRERILTTHVGSLPRSDALLAMIGDLEAGRPVDRTAFRARAREEMAAVVRNQAAAGIDVAGDGEIPRLGFSIYAKNRMSGFGGFSDRGTVTDFEKFPKYAEFLAKRVGATTISKSATTWQMPACTGEVRYEEDMAQAREELDLFAEVFAAEPTAAATFAETFVTVATPGILSTTLLRDPANPAYATDAEYVYALAREMKKEYELIASRGHVLQLDAPDLALERQIMYRDRPLREFLERVELHIDALNVAVADIPREQLRLHLCWGNWEGPHCDDIDLEPLLPLIYRARVGGLSLACANPRHAHETELFRRHRPPADWILFPGCIDVTYNYLEHPGVVAKRIVEFVDVVGDRERVIASTDCGFSTFAGYVMVAEDVAWAKLRALADGAALASKQLWGR